MQYLKYIKSLVSVFFLTFGTLNAQNISIFSDDISGMVGDTVCIDIKTNNFNNISSLEWRSRFDPSVVRFLNEDVTNSAFNDVGANLISSINFNPFQGANGFVAFVWFEVFPDGFTLNDGAILYSLCFEIIGEPCESSIVTVAGNNSNDVGIVISDGSGGEIELEQSEIDIIPGSITVDPDGFVISSSHCSSDDSDDSGSITFAGSGGNGPYSWTVIGNGVNESGSGLVDCGTATVDDLGPGTYTIEINDVNNVTRVEVIEIVSSTEFPFILTLDPTNPSCFDRSNGEIGIANIEGGEGPFTYEWSNLNFVDDTIDDLFTGEYSLTITDNNGCTTSASTIISADTVKVAVDILSGPSCDGSNNGLVAITASGGTPFTANDYDWDVDGIAPTIYFANSGAPTNPFVTNNYPQGCFEVTAKDSLNCLSDVVEFCLEEGSFQDLVIMTTDVDCFGDCNGTVLVTVADMGNFSFMLTDAGGTALPGNNTNLSFDKNDLCAGEYNIRITDTNAGCTKDTLFTIGEPDLLVMSIDSVGPGCGGGDGMVTLSTVGGTMDYTYLWSDAFDQPIRTNMVGGTYSVTVEDANGCRDSIMWIFGDGGDIGLSGIVCQAVSCGGETDGSICASVTASGTFTFSWEDSDGVDFGMGSQIDNIGVGIYYVTATDGMCQAVDTVIVADGQTPSASVVIDPPSCLDSNDGMITATATAGVTPITFEWTQPPSTAVLSAGAVLQAGVGIYNLNITDNNGCEKDTLIEMTGPTSPILLDITNAIDNPCFGSCAGQATFTASGGPSMTGVYTFFISGDVVSSTGNVETVSTLCGGQNFVLATDGICISDTFFFDVPDATPIMIDIAASTIVPPSCDGGDDGSITVSTVGGNPSNYDLLWVNEGIVGNTLTGLVAGEYILEITDGNNCVVRDTVSLQTFDPLTISVNPLATQEVSCASSNGGRITLTVNGGNPGVLMYDWDPNVSDTIFAESLGPGVYNVTVTDINGCTAETSYTLESAPPIIFNVPTPEEPSCFGEQTGVGNITASGGSGDNFTFTINNGPRLPLDTLFNLFASEYLITVFDSAGCSVDTTITIGSPTEINLDLGSVGSDITVGLGTVSDPISVSIVSELDVDSIIWTPFTDIECNTLDCQVVTFSPDATTLYTVTIIDENGCTESQEFLVTVDLARNVFVPNIFSPNGDNINDNFQLVLGSGAEIVNYLHIYDRWGNRVFLDEDYVPNDTVNRGWDGTKDSQELDSGVYVYVAEVGFIDGVTILFKGDITLIR